MFFFGFFSFCSGPGEIPHAHPKCYAKRTGLDLSTSGLCTGFSLGPIVEELCYIRAFFIVLTIDGTGDIFVPS